jgi:hypothetical protein
VLAAAFPDLAGQFAGAPAPIAAVRVGAPTA